VFEKLLDPRLEAVDVGRGLREQAARLVDDQARPVFIENLDRWRVVTHAIGAAVRVNNTRSIDTAGGA
jgi:hypothetical protein